MNKLLALSSVVVVSFVAILLTTHRANPAPAVNTWEPTAYKIWPNPQNSALASDSLVQQAIGALGLTPGDTATATAAGYNKQFTDSVYVGGARYIQLVAVGSGSAGTGAYNNGTGTAYDTILVAHYTRLGVGGWCATSLPNCIGINNVAAVSGANNLISNVGNSLWEWQPEISNSGTPHPIAPGYAKWRVRSGDARGYATGTLATKSPTGNIQIWAYVWR